MAKCREVRVRGVKDDLDVLRRFLDSKVALWSISAKFGLIVDFAVLDKVEFGFLPDEPCCDRGSHGRPTHISHGRPAVLIASGDLRVVFFLRSTGVSFSTVDRSCVEPNTLSTRAHRAIWSHGQPDRKSYGRPDALDPPLLPSCTVASRPTVDWP